MRRGRREEELRQFGPPLSAGILRALCAFSASLRWKTNQPFYLLDFDEVMVCDDEGSADNRKSA
jgi:hypothetical protein